MKDLRAVIKATLEENQARDLSDEWMRAIVEQSLMTAIADHMGRAVAVAHQRNESDGVAGD